MKNTKIINYLLGLLFLTSSVFGCSTAMHKAVNDVKPGMDKSDVLELLGNPKYTKRSNSTDIWKYKFYKNDTLMSKKIYFHSGSVIKVGRTIVRPDLLNHAMNASKSLDEYDYNVQNYLDSTRQKN